MRCTPTPRRPVLMRLPPRLGGTVCRIRSLGSCPHATIEIAEPVDNTGPPVTSNFDVIAAVLHLAWFPCGHEPSWVEHQPHHALADLLLRGTPTMARHLVRRTATGAVREPLTRAAFLELVASGSRGRGS